MAEVLPLVTWGRVNELVVFVRQHRSDWWPASVKWGPPEADFPAYVVKFTVGPGIYWAQFSHRLPDAEVLALLDQARYGPSGRGEAG